MMRQLAALAALAFVFFASAAHAQQVTLRTRIEASGPAVTLGDVFDGAGDASSRAIAPAPPAGQVGTLQVAVLYAAASAAGLDWTPPPGVSSVAVVRPGGARATVARNTSSNRVVADAAVRRGEMVTLTYDAPGMQISLRARAAEDAAVGQSVRLVNIASDRTIDAVVTGPGEARATP